MVLPLMSLGGGFALAPAHAVDPPPFSVTITHTGGTATATTTGKMLGTCTTIPAAEATDPCVYLEVPASGTPTLYLANIRPMAISSIVATGDLIIHVIGTGNVITNTKAVGSAIAVDGTLTFEGSAPTPGVASLEVDAAGTAILHMMFMSVGSDVNPIALTVTQGMAPPKCGFNSPLVAPGSSYDNQGSPTSITVGGVLVVENCVIKSPLPAGLQITQEPVGFGLSFTSDAGAIVVNGNNVGITLRTSNTVSIAKSSSGESNGYSFYAAGSGTQIFTDDFGPGSAQGTLNLEGGIKAQVVQIGRATVNVGSSLTDSPKGITVGESLIANNDGDLQIWTSGNAIEVQQAPPTDQPTDPADLYSSHYAVRALNDGVISVNRATTAISSATKPRLAVLQGGRIALGVGGGITGLGNFDPYVSWLTDREAATCLDESGEPFSAPVLPVGDLEVPEGALKASTCTGEPCADYWSGDSAMQDLRWGFDSGSNNFEKIEGGTICIKAARGRIESVENGPFGGFVGYSIEEGSTVTVELLPDRGYQFISGSIGVFGDTEESVIPAAQSAVATYTFTMQKNTTLSAIFEEFPDFVAPAEGVTSVAGGTIDVSKAGFTVDSGNARVTVADPIGENNFVADVPTGFDDGTLTYMDLGIDSIILAGNEETGWTSSVTLGATPTVEITLALGADLKGYTDYTVLHDTGTVVEELTVTNYNTATGEITFSTDSFSTFAIVHTGVRLPSGGGGGGGTTADAPIAGADRFGTAAAVSQEAFPYPGVPVVYVTSGLKYPDALAASAAAVHQGGPVLLVTADGIPATTADELTRLKPGSIVVLGGPAAVSDAVVTALQAYTAGSVTRVAGADRYATAIQAAQAFTATGGSVVLATGADFPDALSAGTLLSSYPGPVLLVKPGEGLSAGVKAELVRLAPARVFVLGGTSAVSAQAADDAGALSPQVIRLAGANRYATSAAIATWVIANSGITGGVLGTTGTNFPDGLTAGVLTAHLNGAIVLANGTCWSADAVTLFNRMGASTARLIGGSAVMAPSLATLTSCAQ